MDRGQFLGLSAGAAGAGCLGAAVAAIGGYRSMNTMPIRTGWSRRRFLQAGLVGAAAAWGVAGRTARM
ncbi:MAG: hypothetical protein GXY83_11905 [Rhodopirellula sp.]|nr:hypothetical protein [Rhodopirellula sp.]